MKNKFSSLKKLITTKPIHSSLRSESKNNNIIIKNGLVATLFNCFTIRSIVKNRNTNYNVAKHYILKYYLPNDKISKSIRNTDHRYSITNLGSRGIV